MKKKILALLFVLVSFKSIFAQENNGSKFEAFAKKQSDLLENAYNERDVKKYQNLLTFFKTEFNALNDANKKKYEGFLQNAYYNYSCTYALIGNKTKALEHLKNAINAGYKNYSHIISDVDLELIRNEKDFNDLIKPLRAISDYIYILKQSANYNNKDNRIFPNFIYQNKENEDLIALRKGFNLDSIAGGGNEVSRIINLMHWIHNLIRHDGNHENPEVKNAISMINECKKESRGLNCRGLSTVLNECYLAMGFKSRFVTCLPKDTLNTDPDCHVINMVYSTELKKWLWIDPTNNAYLMNQKGTLLSIEEVRELIINGGELLLNPTANWNNKVSKTKEDYIYNYMAKNLYKLQCIVKSEYNAETVINGKKYEYVTLVPNNYFNKPKENIAYENEEKNIFFKHFQTSNALNFWAAPDTNK
jgi:hypothetical protein